MQKKISDILPKTEILAQLAEEASELAQAALKLRRALDLDDAVFDWMRKMQYEKEVRWLSRLEEKERSDE